MPKFVTTRDFTFFQHINEELVDEVVDVSVILYKIFEDATPTNIYGESMEKARYVPVALDALISYPANVADSTEGFGVDQKQNVDFRFVRTLLENVNVYPENGDIIGYNSRYYEIDNVREISLIAERPEYNNSILCSAHLTRRTDIEIEARQV